ncbi:uncharacterized protein LOC127738822 [Mytilus californianus]|uniref:uncharacterized protein LOC127738822 n=1 Tax=Mytilus californianus TaxID=6549 RepID=UPI0022469F12|nr:uncharacterized protein LOC127738822 [Mytilus californianus]
MAKSTRMAQSSISCQLCNNDVVIKWKCTDCELLLCDNCKINIHPRFKSSEKHRVVSTGDIGYDIADHLKALHISEVISSVFNRYQTELPCIHEIICSDDDVVFMLSAIDTQNCHLIKAKLRKDSIKVLQQFDIECQDFAVNRQSEIVFAPSPRSELQAASSTDDIRTMLKASPMMILAIHINKHGELLLGLREQGNKYPVTDFCTRQVVILNTNYQRKATFEYDDLGKKLFHYAYRIESDSDNNIYVVDWINDKSHGRIVGLDMNGRKKFIYQGYNIINTPNHAQFTPRGMALTSKNVLFISDVQNHAIHALNQKGEICGLQRTENLGIRFPYSLSFDSEGFLLIGCTRGIKQTTQEANIHAVKISI